MLKPLNQVYADCKKRQGFWSSLLTPLTYLIVIGFFSSSPGRAIFLFKEGISQDALIALINSSYNFVGIG